MPPPPRHSGSPPPKTSEKPALPWRASLRDHPGKGDVWAKPTRRVPAVSSACPAHRCMGPGPSSGQAESAMVADSSQPPVRALAATQILGLISPCGKQRAIGGGGHPPRSRSPPVRPPGEVECRLLAEGAAGAGPSRDLTHRPPGGPWAAGRGMPLPPRHSGSSRGEGKGTAAGGGHPPWGPPLGPLREGHTPTCMVPFALPTDGTQPSRPGLRAGQTAPLRQRPQGTCSQHSCLTTVPKGQSSGRSEGASQTGSGANCPPAGGPPPLLATTPHPAPPLCPPSKRLRHERVAPPRHDPGG